ncbi:hypothetical protein BKA82DRAFT_4354801 [Pisolithus tinctorius]|nr:hypothetical protein BKA82DRAFT_4354801 [Pisolithus tinctorius]
MDNDVTGTPQALQNSGRPVKAVRIWLKGKEGRDPNLELDEAGVSISIGMSPTTLNEALTPYNIAYLQELVRNGLSTYPGARYDVRDTGELGRLLKDRGLAISLNMSHQVKLMPYSTSRLNPSARSPYDAGFGGDEMNMHIPQSETRAESSQIALIISP